MHPEYASAFASAVEAPAVWAAVVVDPVPVLGMVATVGDVDPAPHDATAIANTMATTGHDFDERNTPPRRHIRLSGVVHRGLIRLRRYQRSIRISICRRYVPARSLARTCAC